MRPILIFGGIILALALFSLVLLLEMTTGLAGRFWNNWLFVQESKIGKDLPWVGPGQKAKFYLKYHYSWNKGRVRIEEWGPGPRQTSTPQQTSDQILNFLLQNQAAQNWPVHDGKKIAPFRFFLVSLDPTIVLMQPAPALPLVLAEQIRLEKESPPSKEKPPLEGWFHSLPEPKIFSAPLKNPTEYRTHLPPGAVWQWFSPDLKQAPVPLPLSDSIPGPVRWPGGELLFQPKGKGWQIERR